MTPERWQQVKIALDQMLDVQPALRSAKLAEVCSGDDELRSEVESLLVFEDDEKVSFTQPNLSAAIQEIYGEPADAFIGRQIGKYKILRSVGMGGMGAVYLAARADGEFDQQLAVKFLRQSFSSGAARRRFAQERRILAGLHHRYIAQLIDGGTTDDGTPFLAMEYVEGIPITDFCRKNDLSVREKLDLFRKVCEAVSFAHRNLIVHRDLKPDNILINAEGIPKLLDFGIAKLLSNTEIKATVTSFQALTPEYAAPEQLAGRDITTASDVYALGVILYEILTETHPFKQRKMSAEQVMQAVILNEPLRPSAALTRRYKVFDEAEEFVQSVETKQQKTVGKILKGDLDTITLKALRKEPTRRYDSVEAFSRDIKSYLKGFPISARPDTFRYRAGKFLLRNPLASAAFFIACVSLIGGAFAAVYQARQANVERARAEKRFNQVRQLANSFMFEINDKIDESPIQARELLVSRAVEYLDALAAEAGNDSALQSELAASYEKIGNVQSEHFKPNSGKTSEALISHQKSLQIRQKLFDDDPHDTAKGLDVVKSLQNIGGVLSMSGKTTDARGNYTRAVDLCRHLLSEDPNNFEAARYLAKALARRGQAILRSGSLAETLRNYEESLEIFQKLSAENPADINLKRSAAIVLSFIGYVKIQTGENQAAVDYFGETLRIETELSKADDGINEAGRLSSANLWYGISLNEAGQTQKGLGFAYTALELQQKVFASDKNNFGEQNALADCYIELAKILSADGQNAAAIENAENAVKNYQAVWQRDGANLAARRQIAYSQHYLADFLNRSNERNAALENYQSALKTMSDLTAADPSNTEWKHDLALCNKSLGEFFLADNDRCRAVSYFEAAEPLLEKLFADSPENAIIRRELDLLKNDLAKAKK